MKNLHCKMSNLLILILTIVIYNTNNKMSDNLDYGAEDQHNRKQSPPHEHLLFDKGPVKSQEVSNAENKDQKEASGTRDGNVSNMSTIFKIQACVAEEAINQNDQNGSLLQAGLSPKHQQIKQKKAGRAESRSNVGAKAPMTPKSSYLRQDLNSQSGVKPQSRRSEMSKQMASQSNGMGHGHEVSEIKTDRKQFSSRRDNQQNLSSANQKLVVRKKRNPTTVFNNTDVKTMTNAKKAKKKNKSDLTSGSNVDQMTGPKQEDPEKPADSNQHQTSSGSILSSSKSKAKNMAPNSESKPKINTMGEHLLNATSFEAQGVVNNEQMLVQDTLQSREDSRVELHHMKADNQEKKDREDSNMASKNLEETEKVKSLAFPEIGKSESEDPQSKAKDSGGSPGAAEDAKQLKLKKEESVEIPPEAEEMNMIEIAELFKQKASLLEEQKQNQQMQLPPLDFYKPKVNVSHECISFGLNMYFKKPHAFSDDPDQGGGDLAPNQPFTSQPWGVMGCPAKHQKNLTDYVVQNIKDVVFCRYGLDYLKSFPRCDDLAIGSYKINLDYLIFQKQKQNSDAENKRSLVEMSFLKTKGQHQMNRAQAAMNAMNATKGNLMNGGAVNEEEALMPPIIPIQQRMIMPFYKVIPPEERHATLEFDSVFESGNLAIAVKVSNTEYNCVLQNDINTNGHTQWFYFKVKGVFKKKTNVKFNLINLYKHKSLYQYGMKILSLDVSKQAKDQNTQPSSPLVSSPVSAGKPSKKHDLSPSTVRKEAEAPFGGSDEKNQLPSWQRTCSNISYVQNEFTNDICPTGLFKVQFTYEFKKGYQEVYFAHSIPYTYSMLCDYLAKQKVKRQTLCHSLAGNKVEYLHITNSSSREYNPFENDSNQQSQQKSLKKAKNGVQDSKPQPQAPAPKIQKQVIMLTSRVHPGETGASWMMHGLIDTLLNPATDEDKALVKNLKDHFEFYIIPMLNVDGVINGNYRCSLAACDLNRKWIKPSKALHPPVYYTKKLCQTLQETEGKQFFLYLDFHGHSVKKNIFQYGNSLDQLGPGKRPAMNVHPSLFPMVLSKEFDYFNFQDCTYSMPKSKDATARIQMFHKLRIPFVFTLEASFAGAAKGRIAGKHFSCRDLMNVGKYVLRAFWECKKLFLNKGLLKQLAAEAQSQVTQKDGDDDSDEGCSSSEEAEPPAAKKAAEPPRYDAPPEEEQANGGEHRRSQKNLGSIQGSNEFSPAVHVRGTGATSHQQKHNSSQSHLVARNHNVLSLKKIGTGSRDLTDQKVRIDSQRNLFNGGKAILSSFQTATSGQQRTKCATSMCGKCLDCQNRISQQKKQVFEDYTSTHRTHRGILEMQKNSDFARKTLQQQQQKLSIIGAPNELDQLNYINGFKVDPKSIAQYQNMCFKQMQALNSPPVSFQSLNYTMFPEENSYLLLQHSTARKSGALPNTLKAHQLNKIYRNKYMMQQNYNQMLNEHGELFHLPEHARDLQEKHNFQGELGSMSPLKVSHSKKQQTSKKKGNRTHASKDLIQLPESIPESVLGQSNRNLYLQQFLQDQLQKKSQDYVAQNISMLKPDVRGVDSLKNLPQVDQQHQFLQAQIQAQQQQVQTLQAQHQLFEQARALFGMHMTKEQLHEFKKQFSIYQQQYVQLNQALLMRNTITSFPPGSESRPDLQDQTNYGLKDAQSLVTPTMPGLNLQAGKGGTELVGQRRINQIQTDIQRSQEAASNGGGLDGQPEALHNYQKHRRYHSTTNGTANGTTMAFKPAAHHQLKKLDPSQKSQTELFNEQQKYIKLPKQGGEQINGYSTEIRSQARNFNQTHSLAINRRGTHRNTRNQQKNTEPAESLARPAAMRMTVASATSATPPLSNDRAAGLPTHILKTERIAHAHGSTEPSPQKNFIRYSDQSNVEQARQSFEMTQNALLQLQNERQGDPTAKNGDKSSNSKMLDHMVRTMYTENPKTSNDLKSDAQAPVQPTNSVNASNNNFSGNIQVLNQNLMNTHIQLPQSHILGHPVNGVMSTKLKDQRGNILSLKTSTLGASSASRDQFSNPPKLNHALRNRQDLLECQSFHKHNTSQNSEINSAKRKYDQGMFSVNDGFNTSNNTRGKIEDRIDFPEIMSIRHDQPQQASENRRNMSLTTDKNKQQQKLPIAMLQGQESGRRGNLQVNVPINQKFNMMNPQAVKKQQLYSMPSKNQQGPFLQPVAMPIERKTEDQLLIAEYLAKRGASQSSQGIKASGMSSALNSGHKNETGVVLAKLLTPGPQKQYQPKKQMHLQNANTPVLGAELDSKARHVGPMDQYGMMTNTNSSGSAYQTQTKSNKNKQQQPECPGNEKHRSNNSIIVIKDGKMHNKLAVDVPDYSDT